MGCGDVLTSFKRVAHVTLNIWRNWQFILSTLLVTFSQIDLGYRVYRDQKTDFVAASRNCTESCSTVCSLPAGVFESTPENAVGGFETWFVPDDSTWKPRERQLPDGTMGSGASWHSRNVWWANPNASAPLYCQWGWGAHFWDEPFELPYVGIFDYTCESPSTRIWMNMRGKFYGRGKNVTADRIQNWLTNDLDTVVPASHAGPWVIRRYIWSTVLAVSALIASTVVFRTVAACRRRYGTLGYLLTLEAQKSNRSAHFRRLIYVACFSVIMITTVPIVWDNYWHMEGFHTAGYVVQTCLAIFQIMAGLYSLLTEVTLVNRRMLGRMDGSLELPMMKWYTPTQTTLAQAFLVALLPEDILLRDKSCFAHASDHVDTTFLRVLSTDELLRVRSFWRVEEQRTGVVAVGVGGSEGGDGGAGEKVMVAGTHGVGLVQEGLLSATVVGDGPKQAGFVEEHQAEPERTSPPPIHRSPSSEQEAPSLKPSGHTLSTRRTSSLGRTQYVDQGLTTLRNRSRQFADRCWRYLHITCSLREHWVIWVGWLSRMPALLSLVLRPPTFIGCPCTCGGTSIKDCFDRVMAQHASTEAISATIFAACIAVAFVTICLKIRLDLDQVRGCEYSTFEYILRLELRKRSFKNRVLIIFTVGFTSGITSILVIIHLAREFNAQGFINIAAVLAEILQTWIAGFILYTEVGFLTPNSVRGAPYVRVPMAFYQPSEWVLARLMKLAMLTDEEILGLPHNLHTIKGIDVSRRFIRRIAPDDLLAIKRSLRAEYTGLFTHKSREAVARNSVVGLLARFNASSSSWGAQTMNRLLSNTSRVACDPEASSDPEDRCSAKQESDLMVATAAGETPAAQSDC